MSNSATQNICKLSRKLMTAASCYNVNFKIDVEKPFYLDREALQMEGELKIIGNYGKTFMTHQAQGSYRYLPDDAFAKEQQALLNISTEIPENCPIQCQCYEKSHYLP